VKSHSAISKLDGGGHRERRGKKQGPKTIKIPGERIERVLLFFRGQKIIIDADWVVLYDVPTKALNQAVKRN
jgi:hypothetical protein